MFVTDFQIRLTARLRLAGVGGFFLSYFISSGVLIAVLLIVGSQAYGFDSYQDFEKAKKEHSPLQLEAMPNEHKVRPGATFWLHLVAFLEEGWHMYSLEKQSEDETVATRIEMEALVFDPQEHWQESAPKLVRDAVMEKIMKTHSGRFEFTHQFSVPKGLKPGVYPLSGALHFRTCDNRICTLPQEMSFKTHVIVEVETNEPG